MEELLIILRSYVENEPDVQDQLSENWEENIVTFLTSLENDQTPELTEQEILDREKEFLKTNATSAQFIASRYNVGNNNRNGVSTRKIASCFGVSDEGTEIEIAARIFEIIEKNR